VPKTSVNEKRDFGFGENEIGLAEKL